MKKVKISSSLLNSDGETTTTETTGELENNVITFIEKDLKVNIEISYDSVIINRKNEDYEIKLEFKYNEEIECKCLVKSLGLELIMEVLTKQLIIENNLICIKYELFNEHQSVGTFEYKLKYEE